MRALLSRLLDVVLRRSREQRLADEVQSHLDLLADEFVAKGLSQDEARLAARKAFGGVDQIKERYRDQRGFPLIAELAQDTRYALRLMARERWFTAATALSLALGIGVTSTIVAILYSMNFRDLPFDDAPTLVALTGEADRTFGARIPLAVFEHWQSSSTTVPEMAAEVDGVMNVSDDEHAAEQSAGTYVSANLFSLLRVQPALGRDFHFADDRRSAAAVAIIAHRLWRDRYGSDPTMVGKTIRINGQPVTVIGVMPDGFMYPVDQQVWQPLTSMPDIDAVTSPRPVRVTGRLSHSVSRDQAASELSALLSVMPDASASARARRIIVIPLNESYFGKVTEPGPMMLLAAGGVVLLIACSHAASLLLARSSARARELSLRAALGAGRSRLIRQLLVESVLIALIAGVFGVALAWFGVSAFANETRGFGMPYWTRFTFDPRLMMTIALICVATGICFGSLPAFQQSRVGLSEVLDQSGRPGMSSPRTHRLTTVLLVVELALTMVLLASATALLRSANIVYRADQIIDLDRLWEFRLALPPSRYPDSEQRALLFRRLDERLRVAQGWDAAALASYAPFVVRDARAIALDATAARSLLTGQAAPSASISARFVAIGERYFQTLGLSIVRGRDLGQIDRADRASAVLVNEPFARRFFPNQDAVGRHIFLVSGRLPEPQAVTIVGIAPALRQQAAAGQTPVVYAAFDAQVPPTASILVRGDVERFADLLRAEVRRLDPDLPLFNLQSLERLSSLSRWTQRSMSTAFAVVGVISLILAIVGVYSLTAYGASQRVQEIGVRMALGATAAQVSWLFLRRACTNTAIGLALGIAGAIAAGGVIQALLVDVRATQPAALVAVALFLMSVATLAAIIPAWRATRLDPVAALRRD